MSLTIEYAGTMALLWAASRARWRLPAAVTVSSSYCFLAVNSLEPITAPTYLTQRSAALRQPPSEGHVLHDVSSVRLAEACCRKLQYGCAQS